LGVVQGKKKKDICQKCSGSLSPGHKGVFDQTYCLAKKEANKSSSSASQTKRKMRSENCAGEVHLRQQSRKKKPVRTLSGFALDARKGSNIRRFITRKKRERKGGTSQESTWKKKGRKRHLKGTLRGKRKKKSGKDLTQTIVGGDEGHRKQEEFRGRRWKKEKKRGRTSDLTSKRVGVSGLGRFMSMEEGKRKAFQEETSQRTWTGAS